MRETNGLRDVFSMQLSTTKVYKNTYPTGRAGNRGVSSHPFLQAPLQRASECTPPDKVGEPDAQTTVSGKKEKQN